jgi:hypothetical protein
MDHPLTAGPGPGLPHVQPRLWAVPAPRSPQDPLRGPRPENQEIPAVPADDDLLERTLRFSGSYVSDDGHVRIRRSADPGEYSSARFLGHCDVCARAGRTPPAGEPLADVRTVVRFVAAHDHGEVD